MINADGSSQPRNKHQYHRGRFGHDGKPQIAERLYRHAAQVRFAIIGIKGSGQQLERQVSVLRIGDSSQWRKIPGSVGVAFLKAAPHQLIPVQADRAGVARKFHRDKRGRGIEIRVVSPHSILTCVLPRARRVDTVRFPQRSNAQGMADFMGQDVVEIVEPDISRVGVRRPDTVPTVVGVDHCRIDFDGRGRGELEAALVDG